MNILFAASEAYPFCKTGGLADVVGSLPKALAENGDNIAVILPLYGQISQAWKEKMTFHKYIYVDLAWRHEYCGLLSLEEGGVTWYFVDNQRYFNRASLYGAYDDGERFAFYSKAVITLLPYLKEMPDVIHCNDWQAALIPVYLKELAAANEEYRAIRTVMTIHNMEYQGRFGSNTVEDLFGLNPGWWDDGTIAMDNDVNLLKASMLTADAVTTVSPTYARELSQPEHAHGLQGIVEICSDKMYGVLNGIDTQSFDPHEDEALPRKYSARYPQGKATCKAELQKELGLNVDPDAPIIGIVSRLVGHKGTDLIRAVFDEIMDCGVQFVVLGTGEKQYEDFFRSKEDQYPGRVAARICYSDPLARRIYAGCDLYLMPSKSEPCGLSQMIAMRYGTIPVVRQTGGLNDSVHDCQVGQEDGTGFCFADYNAHDMLHVLEHATEMYRNDKDSWKVIRKRGMISDFTWNASALVYKDIYQKILE